MKIRRSGKGGCSVRKGDEVCGTRWSDGMRGRARRYERVEVRGNATTNGDG